MMGFMSNGDVFLERDFAISYQEVNYKVKAKAVYSLQGRMARAGCIIDFYSKDNHLAAFRLDTNSDSREEVRKAAEAAFDSGQVEACAKSAVQNWLNHGFSL
jgi:hypothetical protein